LLPVPTAGQRLNTTIFALNADITEESKSLKKKLQFKKKSWSVQGPAFFTPLTQTFRTQQSIPPDGNRNILNKN
jgi:hypothetical protein